jgi:hypothetical protein
MFKYFAGTYLLFSLGFGGWRASDLASGWESKIFEKPQMENISLIITSIGHGLSWGLPYSLAVFLVIANANDKKNN